MPTEYIVTLCYQDRTTTRAYGDQAGAVQLLEEHFFNGDALSFVLTKKTSPWRLQDSEEVEQ